MRYINLRLRTYLPDHAIIILCSLSSLVANRTVFACFYYTRCGGFMTYKWFSDTFPILFANNH